jgi:hypothetical protein
MRAVLAIEDAQEDSGQFGPQIKVAIKVVSDGLDGTHDGAVFSDWLSLDESTGNVKPRSKAWQVIEAVLGEVPAGLEVEDLVGGRFAAQVGLNGKKSHSKIKHDTISPAPRKKATTKTIDEEEIPERDFRDLLRQREENRPGYVEGEDAPLPEEN